MTKLTGRQQLELALLDGDVNEIPTARRMDAERSGYSAECLAAYAKLVKYVLAESIAPDDFGDRLRLELRHAHLMASVVEWRDDGFPSGSLAGQILTAAGVPFKIDADDEPDDDGVVATMLIEMDLQAVGGTAKEPRRLLTPAQREEMGRHEAAIREALERAPKGREATDGEYRLLHISAEEANCPENQKAAALHVQLTADAMRFIVAERLTHIGYAGEMIGFTFAGGAFWIFRGREDYLAEGPDSFGAAVLAAAGFGPGSDVPPLDDEPSASGSAGQEEARPLTAKQSAEMTRLEAAIKSNLDGLPTSGVGVGGAETVAAAERNIILTAEAITYIVAEGLTHDGYAQEMAKYRFAGRAFLIWRGRELHLSADPDSFESQALEAAGYGPAEEVAPGEPELTVEHFATIVRLESEMRNNVFGGESPNGLHVLEAVRRVFLDPARSMAAARHIELAAKAAQYLDGHGITAARLEDVAPSYPLINFVATTLDERESLRTRLDTIGNAVLRFAGLI